MPNIYRITSQALTKSELFISVFEKTDDGTSRGWSVTQYYPKATVFRNLNLTPTKREQSSVIICDPNAGSGAKLENVAGFYFDWDDAYTHEERIEIRNQWLAKNHAMFEDTKWRLEDEYVRVYAPFSVEVVDQETGKVVEDVETISE